MSDSFLIAMESRRCDEDEPTCPETSHHVARFLQAPRRKSVAFVNPSATSMSELARAARQMALIVTQTEEENIGPVVRLTKAADVCDAKNSTGGTPHTGNYHAPLQRMMTYQTANVVQTVHRVLSDSQERPELTSDGTGGVYMIRENSLDANRPVAIFKPSDEEAGSTNNPRGFHGDEHVMREGFQPGSGAVREMVAYKLDGGFAGVPRTAVDRLLMRSKTGSHLNEQSGSIQQYVDAVGDASGFRFDGSEFDEAQSMRVALLDCRMFNCDRHEGNILVTEPRDGSIRRGIVPIDHAFCLPAFGFFREAEFAWRYWLSASSPFGPDVIEYVRCIDVDADVQLARCAGLGESSCATLRVSTMMIKQKLARNGAATASPRDLSNLFMRSEFDVPSPLERLCARALGVPGAEKDVLGDTALIDFVKAQQQKCHQPSTEFAPPPEFYHRFGALLEQETIE